MAYTTAFSGSSAGAKSDQKQGLIAWPKEQADALGLRAIVAQHRLEQLDLFSDEALVDLMDNYPRELFQAFTMGTDPLQWDNWAPVDTAGASGRDILDAVSRGQLWFKLLQIHVVHARYRALIDQLYAELSEQCPNFRPIKKYGTLIISSPTALVYYHVDAQPNLLWHIRGCKRVWVYPAGDSELIDQEFLENIFASFADEEVPYRLEFDQKAVVFDLNPGDVIAFPQNAPHRVSNLTGVNISLSTLHESEESDRRKLIYCANRFLRRTCHLPVKSTREKGIISLTKRLVYRALRRAGVLETPPRRPYITSLRIDPSASTGVSPLLDGPVLTEFSKKDFRLIENAYEKASAVPL